MSKKNNRDKVSEATYNSYETNRKIRRNWGDIKPVTKVIEDKRKMKAKKEKEKEIREYE